MSETGHINCLNRRSFAAGDAIFDEGEPSAAVYRIRSGSVRLCRRDGDASPTVLSILGAGEIFGEAALFGRNARAMRAEAVDAVTVEEMTGERLAAMLEHDVHAARAVIRRLFDAAEPAPPAASPVTGLGTSRQLRLLPSGEQTAVQIGGKGLEIEHFPFVVGRALADGEKKTGKNIDLALVDYPPYSLSRRHFAVDRLKGALVVRDDMSYHGTIVNGQMIRKNLAAQVAPLTLGKNEIVAGRQNSPFRFTLVVDAD